MRYPALLCCAALALGASLAAAQQTSADNNRPHATGVVYHDANANGTQDSGEPGLEGIGVSNGVDVVQTDSEGRYAVPVDGACEIFVVKPAGYETPVDPATNLPRFFYVHRPEGSPGLKHAGVAPTGPLPEAIDFPLYKNDDVGDSFTMVVLGDTQARNQKEVDYISHDIVEELAEEEFLFGATMGDIVFDDLGVLEPITKSLGLVGVPWFHVIGNHDMNYDAPEARQAYETYTRLFGPDYYSFDYGKVHFIALNSIRWDTKEQKYHGGLGEAQLTFVKNDLALVPKDMLVVVLTHIPIPAWDQDHEELLGMLGAFPNTLSFSAHWHRHRHYFLGEDMGWPRAEPHHHVVHATACGSWWGGHLDEVGIPHGVMADGAPNGHSFVTFDGNTYRMRFKAPRRPENYQMDITAPEVVTPEQAAETDVIANVFTGSARTKVTMRLGEEGEWQPMTQFTGKAPHALRMDDQQRAVARMAAKAMGFEEVTDQNKGKIAAFVQPILGRGLPDPKDTDHLWKATLPANREPGYYFIHVKAEDMFGQVWTDRRVIRIEE
ncbi:MAG: calcineurin-like phosphoesterase C-terminal domain-containing protein [Candidatus Hydrogenedentota bacterium]